MRAAWTRLDRSGSGSTSSAIATRWQRLSASVATCAQSYVSDPATYESLAPSPYVVSGQGPWAPAFAAALKTAFTAAAGSGD